MATRKKAAPAKKATVKPTEKARFYYYYGEDSLREAIVDGLVPGSLADVLKECKNEDDGGVEDGESLYIYKVVKYHYKVKKPVSYEEVK